MASIRVGIGGWTFPPWRGVFYPPGLPQCAGAWLCQRAADLDRDQRHLLRRTEAGELRTLARGHAGRLRLRRQGRPGDDPPEGTGRYRGGGRPLSWLRHHRTGGEAWPDPVAVPAHAQIRCRRAGGLPRLAAQGAGRRSPPPRRRGAPSELLGPGLCRAAAPVRRGACADRFGQAGAAGGPDGGFRVCALAAEPGDGSGGISACRPGPLGRPLPRLVERPARSRTCRGSTLRHRAERRGGIATSTLSAATKCARRRPRWRCSDASGPEPLQAV